MVHARPFGHDFRQIKNVVNRAERGQPFGQMKEKKKTRPLLTWFEQIWEKVELVNTNPELSQYLDVDKFSGYQLKVTAKLIGQALPLTPPKQLKTMTPEKLGRVLGQQCATLHSLGEYFQSLGNNLETVRRGKEALESPSARSWKRS
jgi:hypothetical protein